MVDDYNAESEARFKHYKEDVKHGKNPTVSFHSAACDDEMTDTDWHAFGLWIKRNFAWDKRLELWIAKPKQR